MIQSWQLFEILGQIQILVGISLQSHDDFVRKSLLKSGFDPRSRKVANFEALVLHEKLIFFVQFFCASPYDHIVQGKHIESNNRASRISVYKKAFFLY